MPSGSAAVSSAGSASRSTGSREHEVDVLRVALVAGRQGQPEAHLRAGREALGERERELHDAKRALERPGDVAVADPADLAELRVLEPDRVRGAAPHEPAPLVTPTAAGTLVPEEPHGDVGARTGLRSWPVPCEPPAGATGDATTCSRA